MDIPPGVGSETMEQAIHAQATDLASAFRRDGVVAARGVLDEAQLRELAEAVEENLESPGPWASDYTPEGGAGRFFGDYVNWERIDGYRQAALHGPLPRLAADLLGETPRFFHEHTLVKERDTSEVTPWHHDEPYYCVDGASNVSLWVSLDPVPRQAGVEFIVGSHLWGRRFVPRKFVDQSSYVTDANGFELVPDIDPIRDQHEIVSFEVEPGDVIAFHYRTLHSAPGTRGLTNTRRRAVSFRYLGSDARFATRPWLHSPPYEPITPGEPLDNDRFPLVSV
jgi:ectoine hydroxylase-related dioxygenase (phytanoyl-CoA dioxygenase family)